jgi:hypothetical protein
LTDAAETPVSPISRFVAELMDDCANKIDAGQLDEAQEIAETLVCDDPNNDIAIGLLGIIHGKRNHPGTSMMLQGQAVLTAKRMRREQAAHWMNFALTLKQHYHFESAIAAFERAIALDETSAHTFANYSGMWVTMGEPGLAEVAARKALELNPDNATAHLHLGMALLSQDRWLEAWPEMEWRKREASTWSRPVYPMREWDGGPCDVLLVHGEQGLGDELFYCSVLRYAASKAKRIVVECTSRLVPLLRRSLAALPVPAEVYGSFEEAAANGAIPAEFVEDMRAGVTINARPDDGYRICAMGSLPLKVGLTREMAQTGDFLIPDRIRAKYWRDRLLKIANGRKIVGVAWTGGAHRTHKKLRTPPRELFELLDPAKYCLVSVQYTPSAPAQAARMGMLHFPAAISDLDEHAALISALDCLVTVAQTAMHFAGAMDVPTYALIGSKPKWDCGQDGEANPWWRSVKTIRQVEDDWEGVFDRLLSELGEGTAAEIKANRLKASAERLARRADRFGDLPLTLPRINMAQINFTGGADATQAATAVAKAAE